MSDYFLDEDLGVAYKIEPIAASVIQSSVHSNPQAILVHTDVKVTNIRKEKVRRTLSKMYPFDKFDLDSAKTTFNDTYLTRLLHGAKRISEQDYQYLKTKFEM